MKLIHSFSTKRCNPNNLKVNIYCFTLSCIYAKQSGFDIVLYTDNKGASLLKDAPYDEIIINLENCQLPKEKIFAWAKFEALKNEDGGVIHIDGDVFLKKPTLKNIFTFDDCDVIVQNSEIIGYEKWYGWDNSTISFAKCEYPSFLPRECNAMYNCGVVGFKDKTIRDEYTKYYHYLINQYNDKGIIIDSVPDLVAEQQLLYHFCKYKNLKVKEVIDYKNLQSSAKKIGYQHLLGMSKYKCFDKVKETLKNINVNIYNKLEEIKWDL